MKDINYWERFMQTGSINDFLSYKNALRETDLAQKRQDFAKKDGLGEESDAGLYAAYRDDFKS